LAIALSGNQGASVVFPANMRRPLTFEAWKALLRKDCVALEKLQAFKTVGDVILRILFENGTDPTVEGIVRDGLSGKPRATDSAETSTPHPLVERSLREVTSDTTRRKLMPNRAEPIIRCPYCSVADVFRPMAERVEGCFRCDRCGHNAMPLDPDFRCACSKCDASQSQTFPDSL
jgi:hypothetical protein